MRTGFDQRVGSTSSTSGGFLVLLVVREAEATENRECDECSDFVHLVSPEEYVIHTPCVA